MEINMAEKTYKVRITETLAKTFYIIADSPKSALQIADNNYRVAEEAYILDSGCLIDSNMEIVDDE